MYETTEAGLSQTSTTGLVHPVACREFLCCAKIEVHTDRRGESSHDVLTERDASETRYSNSHVHIT